MRSPSIIPNDRLDRDFYIVLEDFKGGAAFRETDEGLDYPTLITDLLSGQYGNVLRVVAFNCMKAGHGTHRKTSPENWSTKLGRKIGVQLPLPLQV